nr:DNA/RNA helicase domain-containing protein [Paenibacillus sp. OK060]
MQLLKNIVLLCLGMLVQYQVLGLFMRVGLQIGCVHTSQGLEFDDVGVIIGNDLKYDSDKMELYSDYYEYKDRMGRRGLKFKNEELAKLVKKHLLDFMSRGMKGCYVYCRDQELMNYLCSRANSK